MNRQLRIGMSAGGLVVAMALAPTATAWAGGSHITHSKHKATAKCPSAPTLNAARAGTFGAPISQKGYEKGWLLCNYSSKGMAGALTVSLYPAGYPLREVSANSAGATKAIHGIGNGASYYNTDVYVQRNSAPSFSVIDQSGTLTLRQTESLAKAIANS